MSDQNRAGVFAGGQHASAEDIPIELIDTKKRIIVEGGEFNFPEWVQNDTKTYTFTGTNYEVIEKLFDLIGAKWDEKVTHVKSGDIIICIRSAFDGDVRTYTGTITQILSAINESCGCKHVESGATMTNHDTGETTLMDKGGQVAKWENEIGGIMSMEETMNYLQQKYKDNKKENAKFRDLPEVYIRAGLPKCENGKFIPSRFRTTGMEERGVSVFPARYSPNSNNIFVDLSPSGEYDINLSYRDVQFHELAVDNLIKGTTKENTLEGYEEYKHKMYLIEGNKIGNGSDGEPLLDVKTIKVVGVLDPNKIIPPKYFLEQYQGYELTFGGNEIKKYPEYKLGGNLDIRKSAGGKVPELNSKGGYDYKGDDKEIAKTVGLLTLPKAIKGTNCSNCLFFLNDYCYHEAVQLPVTSRMCCGLWDSKTSIKAWVSGADNVVFKKLHPVEEYPLNDRGGLDYSGEGLTRAQDADLITLPPEIIGTNCAFKNCKFTDKNDFCTHPKILLPVTPRMSCSLWDNDEAMRSWKGEATEILYKDGEPVIDWKAKKGMDAQVMAGGGRIAQGYINAPYTKLVKILGEPNVKDEKQKIGWFMAIDKNHIGAVWTEADKSVKKIMKEKYHKWFVWGANDESQRRLYDALGFQVRDVDPVKQKEKEKAISIKRWVKKREHIQELSNNTQKIRLKTTNDLKSEDEKEFLTALVVKVMDKTAERVGNCDSEDDGHFGVTGFNKKHIKVQGNEVSLNYVGKSNVAHKKLFSDKRIAKALKTAIKNSPSEFVFTTSDGFRIKCDKVTRYLKPFNITPKDLRGYNANKWIIERLERETPKLELEGLTEEKAQKKRKAVFNKAVKQTAKDVGHGASTLKKHYMIPELADEYIQRGHIIDMKKLGYYHNGGGVEGEGTEKKYHYLEDIKSPFVPVTSYFFNPNEAPKIVEEASMMIADQAETQDEVYAIWEKFPTKEIPFELIYPMQDDMNAKNIEELNELIQKGNIPTRKAYAIEYEGKYYLNDGHHRAIALYLNDKPIVAHVYEIKNDYQQNITMKNAGTNKTTKGSPTIESEREIEVIQEIQAKDFLDKTPYQLSIGQKGVILEYIGKEVKIQLDNNDKILVNKNDLGEYIKIQRGSAMSNGGVGGADISCVCFSEYLEQQHPQLHDRVMNGNMETDTALLTEFNEVQAMYNGGKPTSYKDAGKATGGEWKFFFHPLKHEDGKLSPAHGSIQAPTDKRIFGRDPMEVIAYMAGAYDEAKQEGMEANGKRIVKAVNMHDELIKTMKTLITMHSTSKQYQEAEKRATEIIEAEEMSHGGKPASYQEAGKITEGDWIKQTSDVKVNDGKGIPIVTDKGTPLAYVLKNKFVDGNANANLFASAKTLYETLKMAIFQVNEFWRLSQDLKDDPEKNKKLFNFAVQKLETIRTSGTDALKQAEGK